MSPTHLLLAGCLFPLALAAAPQANQPPVAVNDRLLLRPGATLSAFLPTANDYDPEGGAISLLSFTQPANGTVTQNADGTLRYVPNANYPGGTDTFIYTVQDPAGMSANATVTIETDGTAGRDWPTLGGSTERSNAYPGALVGPLQKKWEFVQGEFSALAVADGRIYFPLAGFSTVDAVSGGLLWRKEATTGQTFLGPSFFNGRVYFQRLEQSFSSTMVALLAADGASSWQTPFAGQTSRFGAPAVTAQSVYHGGGSPVVLSLLHPTSGTSQFQVPLESSSNWTPSVNSTGVYTFVAGRFRRHDLTTGAIDWSLQVTTQNSTPASFAVEGQRAYVAYVSSQGASELAAINLDTHVAQWQVPISTNSAPAVSNGVIYVNSGTTVKVISGTTGQVLATFSTPVSFFGLSSGPLVTADRIVVGGATFMGTGETYVLDRGTGAVLQTLPTNGVMALADDTLFIGDRSRLHAYAITNAANHVPAAQSVTLSAPEDSPVAIQLQATDADGDALSYAVRSLPAQGTLYQTPDGTTLGAAITIVPAAVTNTERRLIYVPPPNVFGAAAASFTFTAHDRFSTSPAATIQIDITNINDAPVAVPDLIVLRVGEIGRFDPTLNDRDADGDPVTVVSFTQGTRGTVSQLPSGLLRYVPSPSFTSGTDSFNYTIQDPAGLSSTAAVTIAISATLGREWLTFGAAPERAGYQPVVLGSAATMTQRWQRSLAAVSGQVAIKEGAAFVSYGVFGSGAQLSRLDALTGSEDWQVTFSPLTAFNAPAVFGDRVYLQSTSSFRPVEARSVVDGSLLWSSTITTNSPVLAGVADELGVFVGDFGKMYGLQPGGGTQFTATVGSNSGWGPNLYQGGLYSYVQGVFQRHDRDSGASLWSANLTWSSSAGFAYRGAAFADGRAFVVNETVFEVQTGPNQSLVALDLAAQGVAWSVRGNYVGTPATAHRAVYAISGNTVVAYDAATGLAVGTYAAPSGTVLQTQPIVTNDTLIVGSSTQTWLFDLKSRAIRQTIPFGGALSLAGYTLYISADNVLRAFAVPTPGNQAPVAMPLTFSGSEDVPLVVTLAGADGNNDPLTFVITRLPAAGRLFQTVDGSTPSTPITAVPTRVTSTAAKVIYLPVSDQFGSPLADFGYVAADGKDLSAEAAVTLNVTPVNDAPVARNDYRQVVPGQILSPVQERLNDSDVDGDALSLVSFTQPQLGRVFQNADGSLRYHAPAGVQGGQDQFNYTVADPGGLQSTATVFVEIVPTPRGLWTSYGNGPDRTGASVTAFLGRTALQTRWTFNTTSPRQVAVAEGRVYVTSGGNGTHTVTALHEKTGATLWSRSFSSYTSIDAPTYHGGLIYFVLNGLPVLPPFTQSQTMALDATTGQTVWNTQGGSTVSEVFAPAVTDNAVYLARDTSTVALNRLTGAGIFGVLFSPYGQPWTPSVDAAGLYTVGSDGFRKHHLQTGAVEWSLPLGNGFNPVTGVLAGSRAFVSNSANDGPLRSIDLATQSFAWQLPNSLLFTGTPAVSENAVYSFSSTTFNYEVRSVVDGRLLATYPTSGFFRYRGQPVLTDELFLSLSETGALTIWDRRTRAVLQSLSPGGSPNSAGPPSVADDALFLSTSDAVRAYAAPAAIAFTPVSGTSFADPVNVTLTAAGPGTIRYTLDGSAPDFDSPTVSSGGSVTLRSSGKVRAILVNGSTVSRICEAAFAVTDADADGIADWWETQNFGSLSVANASSDADGDGASDRDEFFAGTDAKNPADVLRVRAVRVAGTIELTFASKSGLLYRIEESADLQTWTPATVPFAGTGAEMTQSIPTQSATKVVYRVRVLSP